MSGSRVGSTSPAGGSSTPSRSPPARSGNASAVAKIAVIGTGAMGSVYAGLLAAAGNEVWAIERWAEHVEAIRDRGLRVEGASGDRVARLSASVHTQDAGVCDLVVIATKAGDVAAAAAG